MHVPDWDPKLLAQYDPAEMVRQYERAGVSSAMFYCQSHVGLCNWPTRTGRQHANLRGRDVVAEMLKDLKARAIDSCAYYSVVYNTWAYQEHPEWRMQPGTSLVSPRLAEDGLSRYGLCCPNHPGYRRFCEAQVRELLHGRRFDGFFYDMTFWPWICTCPQCHARYRREAGAEIPRTIDWCDPAWCAFQAAREHWMSDFARRLTAAAKTAQPGISVYHNFATSLCNWTLGLSFDAAAHSDFLGADFYGDAVEELVVGRLFSSLTRHRPLEFMTSRCVNLMDHERTKSLAALELQGFATVLQSGAFLMIDAINPEGTVNPPVYDRLQAVFDQLRPYESWLGGDPVEEIGVYFSSESKMDFAENGRALADAPGWSARYPHYAAVRGACRILNAAHLPFGMVTRRQLKDLGRYKVIILPNVLRMDADEVRAIRAYVRKGGRLYASRFTSLTETRGVRHADFMLADVFGCHAAATDAGRVTYLKMSDPELAACIEPQRYLSHFQDPDRECDGGGMVQLDRHAAGTVLARLVVPYSRDWGTVKTCNWTSIHSSPPWRETRTPALVRHRYGKGTCVYAAADIECIESEANDRLFVRLITSLLDKPLTFGSTAHPAVWMTVFHEPDKQRYRVSFLNYQKQLPAIPIASVLFHLRLPRGMRPTHVCRVPDRSPVDFRFDRGTVHADLRDLAVFAMLAIEYGPARG
jgi:hypothetical protein